MVLSLPSVESQVCHVYGAVTVAVKAAGSSLCVSRMLSMQKVQVSIINKGLIIKKRNVKCMVKRDQYDIQEEEAWQTEEKHRQETTTAKTSAAAAAAAGNKR